MFVGVVIFSLANLLIKKRLDIADYSIDFVKDIKIIKILLLLLFIDLILVLTDYCVLHKNIIRFMCIKMCFA